VDAAVEYAVLEAGYRHVDCASIYGNEKEIGLAFETILNSEKVTREDLFITSKLWNTDHEPRLVEKACKQTLKDLRLDYLDLYLIHWGVAFINGADLEPLDENGIVKMIPVPMHQTWQAMEELVEKGLVKSIGVANFTTTMLIDLLAYARIHPTVNQIEVHPYINQQKLIEFCHQRGIAVTAYSPLGTPGGLREGDPRLLDDSSIQEIATAHDKTPAQILLNWAIQRNTIPIPKSTDKKRIAENMEVFDFNLTDEERKKIDSLDRKYRFVNPISWWGIPYFD